MTDDRRRRQYVPLATHFSVSRTGARIKHEYGAAGLGVWACTLAAAKRSQIQGVVIWHSEADAWDRLGLSDARPDFTFTEFVGLLGRLKQARTRRIGDEHHTTITRFGDWNKTIRSQHEAARKRRKRAEKAADGTADDTTPIEATEGELEGEPPYPPSRKRKTTPTNGLVCPHCGAHPANTSELEDHLELFHPQTTT